MKTPEQHAHDILRIDSEHAFGLATRIAALPPIERRLITLLLDRLEYGLKLYGPWKLQDGRNHPKEALEEIIDALHYSAAALLVLRDKS
jgi:hypothetical protein